MTKNYGTISSIPPPLDHTFRQRIRSTVSIQRPWKELLSFSLPDSLNVAFRRIRTNASYFHVNYATIILFTIFFSLLWHPTSLIVFLLMMVAWIFLYFLRDGPVVVFGYGVDERVVLTVLSVSTVVVLFLMHVVVFLVGLAVGSVAVVVHGIFRRTNDLVFDDKEKEVVEKVDLKETASASYSSL